MRAFLHLHGYPPVSYCVECGVIVFCDLLHVLFFFHRLPFYATKFIEMCLMVTADHGPAVSGAHNTIVCARAGKDLISSVTSGLLTIVCLKTRNSVFWLMINPYVPDFQLMINPLFFYGFREIVSEVL